MFTAHSSPNINIKDFLLTIWNSVFPLKLQETLVWFTKPIKAIKHIKEKVIENIIVQSCKLSLRKKNLQYKEDVLDE